MPAWRETAPDGTRQRIVDHVTNRTNLIADGIRARVVIATVTNKAGKLVEHTEEWFAQDRDFRLFAPELGGGALLDLGVYPVSFASMILGKPDRIVTLIDPAFTGVDAQTSMLFGYASGAQAVLTCTLSAKSPTRGAIVGTDARIEIEGEFYAPTSFTLITRTEERTYFETPVEGTGLWHEADEVARCLREGLLESPLMPLDESISIMKTMDAVLAQAGHD